MDKSLNLACIHDEFRENQFFTITLLVVGLGNMAEAANELVSKPCPLCRNGGFGGISRLPGANDALDIHISESVHRVGSIS